MKQTEKEQLRVTDSAAISRIKNDMTFFCGLLNHTLLQLKDAHLIFGDVDDELLREFSCYKTSLAEKRLEAQAKEEADKLPPFQQSTIMLSVESMKSELRQMLNALSAEVELKRLSKGLCLAPFERAQYIASNNGVATYDEDRITAAYTQIVAGDMAEAYVNEARELFARICEFDRKTRLLSGNQVRGVCENNAYKQGIIECYDGKIELDFTRLTELDFTTDEAFLNSNCNPGTYLITEISNNK